MKYVPKWAVLQTQIVTPYAGVWIEIEFREIDYYSVLVTPYAGVWIEIAVQSTNDNISSVTPYAGVWIEIIKSKRNIRTRYKSLPTRECGLKLSCVIRLR